MEQEMERRNGGELEAGAADFGENGDEKKWVFDASVDHRGRTPLRASTGAWRASLFIISIEFSERLSYFGIATNLLTYLMTVLHQDLDRAAKNANYWLGTTLIMPLIGGFLADAYTGRYLMVLMSSVIYILGLGLLTLSQYIPSLKPPKDVHQMVFLIAMYLISMGTGGYKPCLQSFGADQFDDGDTKERKQKMSFFNWWNLSQCCGLFLGVTVIVYVQDNVSWGIASLILTIMMVFTITIFYAGKRFYRYRQAKGSPLTPMLQVLVAAVVKRNVPYSSDPALLYEFPKDPKSQRRLLYHTDKLRFLDRAAIVEDGDLSTGKNKGGPWRLATVTQVEELKLLLHVLPIWLGCLIFGVSVAQTSTFFVKQGATMNRKIGNFEIPPASIYSLAAVGTMTSVAIYDKALLPMLRRATGHERGINLLQRIGFGMMFSILSLGVAALVERKRLISANSTSMSVFWLAPQYLIIGFGDGFALVGLQEYFYDQVPDSMRSLGIALYLSVIGVGSFLSSFLITIVNRTAGEPWIGKSLKESRLDRFYWLLTLLSMLNLCVFVVLAKRYHYKNVQTVVYCKEEGDPGNAHAMA